jgi:small subunit ribosomal protein S27Ae
MAPAPKAAPKTDPAAAKPEAAEAAAPAAKKAEKGKKPKKHKEEAGVKAMYKVEGEKFSRTRPTCERCGPGYFMADHDTRYACGHCGFTRYKQK